jgi:hypothetical protein
MRNFEPHKLTKTVGSDCIDIVYRDMLINICVKWLGEGRDPSAFAESLQGKYLTDDQKRFKKCVIERSGRNCLEILERGESHVAIQE